MKAGATGIRWILELPDNRLNSKPRVLVSPGNRHPKRRNNGPELGRRQVHPKRDHGEAYLQKRAPSWIERPAPAKVVSSEPPSSVNMSEAEAGPAVAAEVAAAGREAAVAAAAGAEGKEWFWISNKSIR
jgi:hypothetical protein